MMHIDTQTFSAAEQAAAARARRERLGMVRPKPVNQAVLDKRRAEAEAKAEQERVMRELTAKITNTNTFIELNAKHVVDQLTGLSHMYTVQQRSIPAIVGDILKYHPGVNMADLCGNTRKQKVVKARHHVWWCIAVERPDISYNVLCRIFKKDHTSIYFGIRKYIDDNNLPPYVRRKEQFIGVTSKRFKVPVQEKGHD